MKTLDNRIESIKIVRSVDVDNDTSHIGTFGSEAKSEFAINHHERQGQTRNTFQWFNPASVENCKGEPDADIKKYAEQDYKRIMVLERQDWYFMGITAEAKVYINGVRQTITSGGLWGIESNQTENELKDIEIEQLSELRDVLEELGFKKSEIVTDDVIERIIK